MATTAVTDASFKSDVLESEKPVLVDFWADWCGPCKMIAPALEELSEELGDKVTIAKMDIMENPDVPGSMGVQSIPYLVLFKNGEPAAQMRGAAPKGQLKQWLEGELSSNLEYSSASSSHRVGLAAPSRPVRPTSSTR